MSATTARLPRQVIVREVGLRDGLQSIATIFAAGLPITLSARAAA